MMTEIDRQGRALRVAPRRKTFQPVALRADGGEHRAHLLNISRSGAQVHSAHPVAPGTRLILAHGEARLCGQVVWVREGRFGMRFNLPLADAHVEAIAGGA